MKTQNKFLHLFILIVLTISVKGQSVKTFSGGYKNGHATYSYFEKGDNRIYEGNFSYKGNTNISSSVKRTLSGSFKNGLRDGEWSFSDKLSAIDNEFNAYLRTVTGGYIDGQRTGKWNINYKSSTKQRTLLTQSLSSVQQASATETLVSNANFKDNLFDGSFYLKEVNSFGEINEYTGQFNHLGFMDGTWTMISKDAGTNSIVKTTLNYKSGFLRNSLEIDNSTGEILEKKGNLALIDSILANFYDDGTNLSFYDGKYYIRDIDDKEHYFIRIWKELELLTEINIGEKDVDFICTRKLVVIPESKAYSEFKDSIKSSNIWIKQLIEDRSFIDEAIAAEKDKKKNEEIQTEFFHKEYSNWSKYKLDFAGRSSLLIKQQSYSIFLDYLEGYFRGLLYSPSYPTAKDIKTVERYRNIHDKLMALPDKDFKTLWKQINISDYSPQQCIKLENLLLNNN